MKSFNKISTWCLRRAILHFTKVSLTILNKHKQNALTYIVFVNWSQKC